MNTYFVKGRYIGEYAQEIDFGIVFDLRPVQKTNIFRIRHKQISKIVY